MRGVVFSIFVLCLCGKRCSLDARTEDAAAQLLGKQREGKQTRSSRDVLYTDVPMLRRVDELFKQHGDPLKKGNRDKTRVRESSSASGSTSSTSSISTSTSSTSSTSSISTTPTTEETKAGVLAQEGFVQRDRVSKSHSHTVVFATVQRNVEELKTYLADVANPASPRYGRWMTREEVFDLTNNEESVRHVERYLTMNGVQIVNKTRNGAYITAVGSIGTFEEMFSTQFFEFERAAPYNSHKTKTTTVRALSYTLPVHLQTHVTAVFNTVQFVPRNRITPQFSSPPLPRGKRILTADDPSSPDDIPPGYLMPSLLHSTYNIDSTAGSSKASQSIFASIGQAFSPKDLTAFQSFFGLVVSTVQHVINGHSNNDACDANDGNDCAEANLDVQWMMATSQNTPTTFDYWDDDDFLLSWLIDLSHRSTVALVHSISYGIDEAALPDSYAAQFETEAAKLSVQGITIVSASGDDGAVTPDAKKNPLKCIYSPSFPASSPYVLAVGGTMGPEMEVPTAETACTSEGGDAGGTITSGGGFSTLYAAPDWQKEAIDGYWAGVEDGSFVRPFHGYNKGGRGLPDVSALSHNYIVAVGLELTAVSGTSASSPVMAGMLSLVNAARLKAGYPSVGWIHPTLYRHHARFTNDVTSGRNNCVSGETVCCEQGFTAQEGWDPVTGFGSVDFVRLRDLFMEVAQSAAPKAGEPTAAPTTRIVAPPSEPSFQPTASPTLAAGWMGFRSYDKTECGGSVASVYGIRLGQCFKEYDDDMKVIGSRKYTCDSTYVSVEYYSDSHCGKTSLLGDDLYALGCAGRVEDYYYYENWYSTELQCSADTDYSALLPALTGVTYMTLESYDDTSGCAAGNIVSFDAYREHHCFEVPSMQASYQLVFPQFKVYEAASCSGKAQKETEKTTCAVPSDDGGDDGQAYYDYGYDTGTVELHEVWVQKEGTQAAAALVTASPTFALTSKPSAVPTVAKTNAPSNVGDTPRPITTAPPSNVPISSAPTATPVVKRTAMPQSSVITGNEHVTFSVTQVLSGVTAAQWFSADEELFSDVFAAAVAGSVDGISASNVLVRSVLDSNGNGNRNIVNAAESKSLASNSGILVIYALNFDTYSAGFSSAFTAYTALSAELRAAVGAGHFQTLLQSRAATSGAALLARASVPEPRDSSLVISTVYSSEAVASPIAPPAISDDAVDKKASSGSGEGDGNGGDAQTHSVVVPVVISIFLLLALVLLWKQRKVFLATFSTASGSYAQVSDASAHSPIVGREAEGEAMADIEAARRRTPKSEEEKEAEPKQPAVVGSTSGGVELQQINRNSSKSNSSGVPARPNDEDGVSTVNPLTTAKATAKKAAV